MVSKRQRGSSLESQVRQLLIDWGYSVHRSQTSVINRNGMFFCNSNDVFHAIDIIALKPDEKSHWLQVTSDSGMGRKIDKLAPVKWNYEHSWIEVWKATGGGRYVIMLYNGVELKRVGEVLRRRLMMDADSWKEPRPLYTMQEAKQNGN